MRLPIDVEMIPAVQSQTEYLEATIQALLEKREEVFGKAMKNIADAQKKQRRPMIGSIYKSKFQSVLK